ncbi:aldehyde dehydrogenase EutE (plasmid) [Cereibacter sphaeroides]|uniref:aldehyde dehydrogenase family protein n=1 Tax=Cereibacter sphaeroides TaxID=1063 RepID=UPI000F544A02|nr:aldehyde dehydrogenase family protein [Cereibacter sphaeroides]AZB66345.1 aldehyde dehydrogenase EutE [Cereibacter sphaeroides]AZB71211.1 aldehyde dehydrogenase EutE [Cereibacter sphaeroides]
MKDHEIEDAVARVLSGYVSGSTPAPVAPTMTAPAAARPQAGVDALVAKALADLAPARPSSRGCVWETAHEAYPIDDIVGGLVTRALGERNCSCCKAGECSLGAGCLEIGDAEAETLGDGIFATMDEAVEAAAEAQRQYLFCSMAARRRFVKGIREVFRDEALLARISKLTVQQTGMGNVEHKIIKNRLAAEKTPGVEDLGTEALSGDDGLTLVELSAYGVIGAITPTTNPTETIICNSIGMLAAGNAAVFSPHPRARGVSLLTIKLINRKLAALGAPANLVVTVQAPSIENTNAMMAHPKVRMLVATGGPAIVKTVLSSGKKAIGAGAGNPPVVVDETADIPKAAQDIVNGCSFDNNMPCVAEKEVIAVAEVADFLIAEMRRNGAWLVTDAGLLQKLEALVLTQKGGPQTGCVGKSAVWLLSQVGVEVGPDVRVILVETTKDHPFVQEELMMPILPLVRVPCVDEAIDLAVELEHGNRHTAVMHSTNVRKLTRMAKLIQTTIFVKNGPSYAGLGVGGEGYTTFTIAGPTGEGLTSARSFARRRKCVMVEALNVR